MPRMEAGKFGGFCSGDGAVGEGSVKGGGLAGVGDGPGVTVGKRGARVGAMTGAAKGAIPGEVGVGVTKVTTVTAPAAVEPAASCLKRCKDRISMVRVR